MLSTFENADWLSLGAFCVLIVIMFCILLYGAKKIDSLNVSTWHVGKVQIGLLAYLALFSIIVGSGAPTVYFFPVVPILFLGTILLCLWFSFSKYGLELGSLFSLQALVGFQCFRIPLEIILHHWSKIGTVPETMTWTGQNFDIFSGVAALLMFPFIGQRKSLAWIPNCLGLLLLLNVLRVVVMSSPFPFSWPLEKPLQLIMHMPYALIIPLCVAPALIGHMVTLRILLNRTDTIK
jgi:hypothetical protein